MKHIARDCLRIGSVFASVLFLPLSGHAQTSSPKIPPASSPIPPPSVSIAFDDFRGSLGDATAQNVRLLYGGELSIRADRLQGNLLQQQFNAVGHMRLHEADTDLSADMLRVNGQSGVGTATRALLTQDPYSLRANQIDLTAESIVAHVAEASNAPPGTRPDLGVRAQTISLFPDKHHGELRNASLYLFGTHLLTVPRVGFALGANARNANQGVVLPGLGYSARYGTYAAFAGNIGLGRSAPVHYRFVLTTRQQPQLRATSHQTLFQQASPAPPPASRAPVSPPDYLGALRKLATIRRPPLPENDPLLFHDYLPEPNPINLFNGPALAEITLNEVASTHQEAIGRRIDNLYVSRLPEVALGGQLPLGSLPAPQTSVDPEAFRRSLRRLHFVASAQIAYGSYREQRPDEQIDSVRARRQRDSLGLRTLPILIAPNTVLLPQVQVTTNFYNGRHSAYRFAQLSVAANHYFSPHSALGLQYLQSGQTGDSPFDFDVLDTTRELDTRIQFGNRRLAVAALVRYDLVQGGVIDYKLAVAPGLQGITPIFSYNFRSRNIGFGLEIRGISGL